MFWQKIRSSVMFVTSFIACSCHLPITLPLALASLTGIPLAVWMGQHVGWMYGGMTGVFLLSLTFGFLWSSSTNENAGEVYEPRPSRPKSITKGA